MTSFDAPPPQSAYEEGPKAIVLNEHINRLVSTNMNGNARRPQGNVSNYSGGVKTNEKNV